MRQYNFSAGPAMLPGEVIDRIRSDLPEWNDLGASVLEVSHRGDAFDRVAQSAEANLRELLGLGENGAGADYAVMFLQGGATTQFSLAPLNLACEGGKADYVVTGNWGKKAVKEASPFIETHVAASSEDQCFTTIPDPDTWDLSDDAAYLHLTPNETIQGVEFHFVPEANSPLVADMSSTILSRPIDVSNYGVIYAGAQKNVGPAGLTLVIVRRDLLEAAPRNLSGMFSWANMAATGSMYNTPPTFPWYVAGLVFEWILDKGGLEAMGQRNQEKADLLYRFIDGSDFYSNPVDPGCRSWMNVPFMLADDSRNAAFLEESSAFGLLALKGHRSVGGMRASIYNAMPLSGVQALVDFMADFANRS